MSEQFREITLKVPADFQLPDGLDEPHHLTDILTKGHETVVHGLPDFNYVRLLEEKVELLERKNTNLKEKLSRASEALTANMLENARTQERQRLTSQKALTTAEEVYDHITSIFPSALIQPLEDTQGMFLLTGEGIRIMALLDITGSGETVEDLYQEMDNQEVIQAGLFISLINNRVIHGASNVYYKELGRTKTPIVYLGKDAVHSKIVLQLTVLLLKRLVKNRNKENQEVRVSSPVMNTNKIKVPKRSREEVVAWLKEYGSLATTADELRQQMPLGQRNLNELKGINSLKDEAFGTNTSRRGRSKAQQQNQE